MECIFTRGLNLAMQDVWNKTYYPKADDHKNVEKKWYIVDAADKRLGRLASTIAIHIRGKNMASFTPSIDMGAYVIVVHHISLHYPMVCPMFVANYRLKFYACVATLRPLSTVCQKFQGLFVIMKLITLNIFDYVGRE